MLFNLVNYLPIVEGAAVVFEVDGLRGLGEQVDFSARVIVPLFEGLEGGRCLTFEAKRGGDFVPVEFEGGGALGWMSVDS
jgi:hypothetical protein